MANKEKPQKEKFDQVAYNNEYNRENYKRISVLLSKKTEAHIISFLETKRSMSTYIKNLILKDMDQ